MWLYLALIGFATLMMAVHFCLPRIERLSARLEAAGGGTEGGPAVQGPAELALYSAVRVSAIRDGRFSGPVTHDERHPRVGDVGVIVEVYRTPELGYEVECSDPETARNVWLTTMHPDELQPLPCEAGSGAASSGWQAP